MKATELEQRLTGWSFRLSKIEQQLKEKEEELQVDAKKLQNPDYVARYASEKYSYSQQEIIGQQIWTLL